MPQAPDFDPDKVAYFEKAGWEAYYDRNWPRTFWLLVQLNHAQFRMSWPLAFAAALDMARASLAWAPIDHDVSKVKHFIQRYYTKARRSLNLKADAQTLAALELDYWVVHRELAIRRAQNPDDDDLEPLIQSFMQLHAAIFESTPERMRESAEQRALSTKTVDLITSNRSTDVPGDWRKVKAYLQQAYRAVKAVNSER